MLLADRTRFPLRATFAVLLVTAAACGAAGQDAKKEPAKTRVLNAKFNSNALTNYPEVVLVQLYQEGKLLREKEVSSWPNSALPKSVVWAQLPPGRYEVHFEARGFARAVKKVFLSEEDEAESTILIEIDQKADLTSGGDGPTLHGLAEEIKKLKEEVARLKAQLVPPK